MTRADLETLLDDAAFCDGRADARLGAARAARERLGRAQEHAHRLLEHMLWVSDAAGRIVLPGSAAEEAASTRSGHFLALVAIAETESGPGGRLRRTAAAARAAAPGWPGLARVLAAFQDDLREAVAASPEAGGTAAWPVRAIEDEAAYRAPGRAPVLALREAARAEAGLFEQVFVHGSLATLDERPGVSDLDVGVVLAHDVARDPEGLLAVQAATGRWWRHLQDVDPLQHHGVFAYTAADLDFYPETFLPLAVLAEARSILGDLGGRPVRTRPTGLARRLTLLRAAAFLRRPAPASLFSLKMYLQSVLLAPVFLQQGDGPFVYKRDAFAPFEARADEASARAVALASRARAEDWYADDLAGVAEMRLRLRDDGLEARHDAAILQRALDRAVGGRLVLARTPAAARDRGALADLLEGAAAAARDADARNDEAPAAPVRRSPRAPGAPATDAWTDTARAFVDALGDPALVTAAWSLGTRGPGSDLDLVLVVDPARAARFDWSRLYGTWAGLPAPFREVMIHPPSAILSPARARELGRLFPVFHCTGLWGPPPDPAWWRCTDPGLALGLLADYAMAQYPGEFLDALDAPTLCATSALGRVGAIRHALALARLAGLAADPAADELARSALALRAAGEPDPERVRPLLEGAVGATQRLVGRVAERIRSLGFGSEGSGLLAGMVGDRVLLLSADSAALAVEVIRRQRARLGSPPVNAAPLALAWGLLAGVGGDPQVQEIFGDVVELAAPLRLPPAPPAWGARWRAVAAHAAELRAWGCAGGYLFPNHLHLDPGRFYAAAR